MKAIAVILLFALAGCAPHLVAANERGGIINVGSIRQADGFALADSICHRYGRSARISSNMPPGQLTFDCVGP